MLEEGHDNADGSLNNGNGASHDGEALHGKRLSEREEAVLRLIAKGYNGKEIAVRLDLSAKTVETYKSRALKKLGFTGRPDVIRYALEHGWFDDPGDGAPA